MLTFVFATLCRIRLFIDSYKMETGTYLKENNDIQKHECGSH